MLRLWAYYALLLKYGEEESQPDYDFFEIAVRAISRKYIPKFYKEVKEYAYYQPAH